MLIKGSLTQFLEADSQAYKNNITNSSNLLETIAKFIFPRWHSRGICTLMNVSHAAACSWMANRTQMPAANYRKLAAFLRKQGEAAYMLAQLSDDKADALDARPYKLRGACSPEYIAAKRAGKLKDDNLKQL